MISYFIFVIGMISSALVGGNNLSPSLGVMLSTNVLKRKMAYLFNSIALMLGVSLGGISMLSSIKGIVSGEQVYVEISLLSVLIAASVSFYVLNRTGIPSSLSQMIYPSLVVVFLLNSKYIRINLSKFLITVESWGISPLVAILSAFLLYSLFSKAINPLNGGIAKTSRLYRIMISGSSFFVSFVTGANAIGIISSAGSTVFPFYVVLPSYGAAAVLGMLTFRKTTIVSGFKITKMGYVAGSSAMIGSSVISEVFTLLGIPISITQTLLGGIIGLSFRALTPDITKQLKAVGKGWITGPSLSVVVTLAVLGIIKSLLGI
ncbi:phosphate permease [Sulfolobales archaeon HS-7]|nr:phosphate permease [Sulfolobales archaeon HS-7]